MKVKQWYKRRQAIRRARGVLSAAQDLIYDPWNWGKEFMHRDGKYCALGALTAAYGKDNVVNGVAFRALTKGHTDSITRFNDAPSTQHSDVMERFNRAYEDVPQYV